MLSLLLVLFFKFQLLFSYSTEKSYCELKFVVENRKFLKVLWVNTEDSTERRKFMNATLTNYGFRHSRVNAATPDNLIVPRGFLFATDCLVLTENARRTLASRIKRELQPNVTHPVTFLASHCGKSKNNFRFNSLANTASHLLAIYRAVFEPHDESDHNNPVESDYALIMEDDLRFAYEINLSALVASAPKNFSILQLVTNNPQAVKSLWEDQYITKQTLWVQRKEFDDYWSSGAFLIQRKQFIGLIDKIVHRHEPHLYSVRIEAYDRSICKVNPDPQKKIRFTRPYCCNRTTLMLVPPCILSAHGYEADSFIYNLALGSTYMLTVPIILPFEETAYRSTQHQDHISLQQQGFALAKSYLSIIHHKPQEHLLISPLLNLNCSR